jgi:hypothetical protein
MDLDAFMKAVAEQFMAELIPNASIKQFTTNTDVIGAYAEASVRRFVARMVDPARVSTGAVISEKLCASPKDVPQVDTIIWLPMPLLPIFEVGEFGLVPAMSTLGILEVKRSNYSGIGKKIAEVLNREGDLVCSIKDPEYDALPRAMGVICVREDPRGDKPLQELIDAGRAVVLLEKDDKGAVTPNHIAIYRLVDFLMKMRRKMTMVDGKSVITFTPKK